jgi:hypothetical protein
MRSGSLKDTAPHARTQHTQSQATHSLSLSLPKQGREEEAWREKAEEAQNPWLDRFLGVSHVAGQMVRELRDAPTITFVDWVGTCRLLALVATCVR